MEEQTDISPDFKKSPRPSVPQGFFESFYDTVKAEIDAAEAFRELGITKSRRPELTVNLSDRILSGALQKNTTRPGKTRIFRLGLISTFAAAAVLTVFMYIRREEPTTMASAGAPKTVSHDEMMDTYMAYLDEDELIDYILENDISLEDEVNDDLYDLVESDIEDVYLDL